MRFLISHITGLTLSLLLANTAASESADLKDETRLYSNISISTDILGLSSFSENPDLNLNARAYVCSVGYTACAYDSTRCCPIGGHCCGNGYCADIGETCCSGGGTCRSGYKCCANSQGCAPIGAECCSDGTYCRAGKRCRTYLGEKLCCAASGCIGENDAGGDDSGITAPTLTQTATATEVKTKTATSTYLEVDWEYYYTTIYWTYWYYFWTSYAPYTVQTVTSTRTSTTTVWSVYATNSLEAKVDLISSSRDYTFSAPYSATSLRSSSDPVTLSTVSDSPTATASSSDGGQASESGDSAVSPGSTDAAAGLSVSGTGLLAAVLVAAIGGLAFGL